MRSSRGTGRARNRPTSALRRLAAGPWTLPARPFDGTEGPRCVSFRERRHFCFEPCLPPGPTFGLADDRSEAGAQWAPARLLKI